MYRHEFGIPGYDDLVWDVSLVCDRIGNNTQHGLNGQLQISDYLHARGRIKIIEKDVITLSRTSLSHSRILGIWGG